MCGARSNRFRQSDPAAKDAVLIDQEEAAASTSHQVVNRPLLPKQPVSLRSDSQLRTAETEDRSPVASKWFQRRLLPTDSFILREQCPTAGQSVLNPFRVTDLLSVVMEMLSDEANVPAMLRQYGWRALAQAAVREELRRRPG